MDQSLRHWIIRERIFSWFHFGPSSFPNKYSSCGWAGRISFLWFCLGLWSACKITRIQFQRMFFSEVSCSLSSCSLLFKFVTNLFKPWEIPDSWVRIFFVHSLNSDLQSIFTLQATSCNFQYGPNFGVSLWSCDVESSLGRVYSRQATAWNCENFAVSFIMWNTVRFQLWSGILHPYKICSICLVVITFQFFLHLCNRNSLCARSSLFKDTFVLITLGTNEELDCPLTTGPPVLSW